MSGRRGGRKAKGRGGKNQGGAQTTLQPKPTFEPENPLQILLKQLLQSAFEDFPKDSIPDEETTYKYIHLIDGESRQILKEPKPAEYQKYAIKFCLTLQQTANKLNGNQSRQVVGIFFTYLMEELTKHWNEYGIAKEDVHKDYWKAEDIYPWRSEGITEVEYENWIKAFHYLKGQKY